jgi:hypothetical protein
MRSHVAACTGNFTCQKKKKICQKKKKCQKKPKKSLEK